MLGKLLKHEFRATRRILLPINLALIVITLIGCIVLSTNIFDSERSLPLAVFLVMFYIFSLLALGSVSYIYLLVRFYKNLFTAEGYLMFTLPATPFQLFHAKLITGYVWALINTLLTLLSVFALGFSAGFHAVRREGISGDAINEFFSSGITLSVNGVSRTTSFENFFGISSMQLILYFIGFIFIGNLFSMCMGYMSIALGQLMEKYKLAASIGFYIAVYVVTQLIITISTVLGSLKIIMGTADSSGPLAMAPMYQSMLLSTMLTSLICGIIFYVVSLLIMKRNVNLE